MVLKVTLAGGGTAGHVNPLLATARVLRDRGAEVNVLGTAEGLEADLVPQAGFPLITLPKAPLPRTISLDAIRVPGKLRQATSIAGEVLQESDALVGFGGYVSAPAYFAAARQGLPFVVQEQNVKPGIANRVGALWASGVSLAFPQTSLKAKSGKTVFTGMPLRREIVALGEKRVTEKGRQEARTEAALALELDPDMPTLLVMGGSLGAQHINEVLGEAAREGLLSRTGPMQILHLTGKGKAEAVRRARESAPSVAWHIQEYMEDMDLALSVADLVVCRSGAGTVAELGVLGQPAVYVPLPIGNGEQLRNAEGQINAGGALAVRDEEFDLGSLQNVVLDLLFDRRRLREMGEANRATSPGDGANLLSDMVEEAVSSRRKK